MHMYACMCLICHRVRVLFPESLSWSWQGRSFWSYRLEQPSKKIHSRHSRSIPKIPRVVLLNPQHRNKHNLFFLSLHISLTRSFVRSLALLSYLLPLPSFLLVWNIIQTRISLYSPSSYSTQIHIWTHWHWISLIFNQARMTSTLIWSWILITIFDQKSVRNPRKFWNWNELKGLKTWIFLLQKKWIICK